MLIGWVLLQEKNPSVPASNLPDMISSDGRYAKSEAMNRENRIINLVPDATLFGSIVLAYFLDRIFPSVEIFPYPINLLGWLMIAAGSILAIRTISSIRSQRASPNVTGVSSALLTKGFFSYTRNPLYLSYVAITLGAAVVLGSLAAFIGPVVCATVLNFFIIPLEEKNLQKTFGQKYEQYKRSVRRWI